MQYPVNQMAATQLKCKEMIPTGHKWKWLSAKIPLPQETTIFCTFRILLQLRECMTIWELRHNENLLISGKRWAEHCTSTSTNLLRGAQGRKPSCISDYYKTYYTSALFWDKPNVQHDSQITYFQAVENKSAPRSKFVEMTWDNILLMILHNILLITCQDQEFALIIYPDSITSVWASVLPYRTACSLKPYLAVCNWLF